MHTKMTGSQQAFSQNESCLEEDEICNWMKKVVAIKTPTMVASGILLSDDLIVCENCSHMMMMTLVCPNI